MVWKINVFKPQVGHSNHRFQFSCPDPPTLPLEQTGSHNSFERWGTSKGFPTDNGKSSLQGMDSPQELLDAPHDTAIYHLRIDPYLWLASSQNLRLWVFHRFFVIIIKWSEWPNRQAAHFFKFSRKIFGKKRTELGAKVRVKILDQSAFGWRWHGLKNTCFTSQARHSNNHFHHYCFRSTGFTTWTKRATNLLLRVGKKVDSKEHPWFFPQWPKKIQV